MPNPCSFNTKSRWSSVWSWKRKPQEPKATVGLLCSRGRDMALILLGLARLRSDELCRLQAEYVAGSAGSGISLYLPRSKSDRDNLGRPTRRRPSAFVSGAGLYRLDLPKRHLRSRTGSFVASIAGGIWGRRACTPTAYPLCTTRHWSAQ